MDAAPRQHRQASDRRAGVRGALARLGRWLRGWGLGRRITAGLGLVVLLGTFSEALDGALDRLEDRCRQFELCNPLPPAVLVGTLTEVRPGAAKVPQAVAWAERGLATPTTLTKQDAAWPGRLVTYRVEFRGLGDALCSVRWTLLDAASGQRVADDRSNWRTVHAPAFPDSRWKVEAAEEDANVGLIWVPYVAAGRFVVEVELLDPGGVHLDVERTVAFVVAADDLPGGREDVRPGWRRRR